MVPPPELVEQWCHEDGDEIKTSPRWYQIVATKAARWGADQELEACCEYMQHEDFHGFAKELRAARRPKPPSLKELALDELDRIPTHDNEGRTVGVDVSIIRRALEALPE